MHRQRTPRQGCARSGNRPVVHLHASRILSYLKAVSAPTIEGFKHEGAHLPIGALLQTLEVNKFNLCHKYVSLTAIWISEQIELNVPVADCPRSPAHSRRGGQVV